MKSIPDHVLKNAVVVVPKGTVNLSFVLLVMLGGAMLSGLLIFLMAEFSRFSPITLSVWFYVVFGCVPGFAVAFLLGWLDFRDSMLDVIVGRDALKGEIVIAQRRFGRPRKVIQIALAKVQAICIYWLAVSSGNPDVGWWSVQLVLLDGKGIPLINIKGKPAAPPDRWLADQKSQYIA